MLFEALEPRLLLTTYVVDSLADNHDVDGLVTIREAVTAANSDQADGDALAGNGADTITFHPSLTGQTILLDGLELVVAEDLTIAGPGAGLLTVDADNRVRHFEVNPGVTLTMSGLTLDRGNAGEGDGGGAIYSDGTLVLTDCVLSNNRAGTDGGAIYGTGSSPTMTLTDCVLLDNTAVDKGGGIHLYRGQLALTGGRFEGNSATYGGGVYAQSHGTIVIDGTDFTDNTALYGGGLMTQADTTVTGEAEFAGNQAGSQGGAIWSSHVLDVTGGEFRGNSAPYGGAMWLVYWYPATLTDVDFEANTATDQGGVAYVSGNRPVLFSGGTQTGNRADGSGGALFTFNGVVQAEGTKFRANSAYNYGGAIDCYGGTLLLNGATFDGNTTDTGDGGALFVRTYGAAVISDTDFLNNTAAGRGGAIYYFGQPFRIGGGSSFENNTAAGGSGGAIRNTSEGTIAETTFRANKARDNGGAIYTINDDCTLEILDSLLELNQAGTDGSGEGGAVWSNMRRIEIDAGTIRGNQAAGNGGGILVREGLLVLTDSLLASNTAGGVGGGAIVRTSGELAVANSTISGNSANGVGGGLYITSAIYNDHAIVNTTITANRSDADGDGSAAGGGICTLSGNTILHNTLVAGNFAGGGTDASDLDGTLDAGSSHNLIGDAATAGGLLDGVNGNRVGVDPLLGPLADNGGRSMTHALDPAGPAVDAGDNTRALYPDGQPIWTDQRGEGFDRLIGLHVDIGAYEADQPGGQIHGRKWFDLDRNGLEDEPWGASIAVNGGFEEGDTPAGNWTDLYANAPHMTGWRVLKPVQIFSDNYCDPAEGHMALDLNWYGGGAVAQTLATEPGRTYRVTFQISGMPYADQGPKPLRVSAAGESEVFTFDTTGQGLRDMGWRTETWEFVAQNSRTQLTFESLSATLTPHGPMIDNVVVQPYGRDDVRIYLDTDGSGAFEPGEPLTYLRPDNPDTSTEDETATYRFVGLPAGDYTVRETVAGGIEQIYPAGDGSHDLTIAAEEVFTDLDFGNRWDGVIRGVKFLDLNGNGVRDRDLFQGDPPTVLMVVDVSDSVDTNCGFVVGDVNYDGQSNWVLDAEIHTMLALQQELIDLGWGGTARVGVVVFGSLAASLDMDPATPGIQLLTSPAADANGDDTPDLEAVLRSIRRKQTGTTPGNTDYEVALQQVLSTLVSEGVAGGETTLVMASDGLANSPWSFADEVAALEAMGVQTAAWGFGTACELSDLRRIDARAERLGSLDDVARAVSGRSRYGKWGTGRWLEPGMPGVTIYIDADNNGVLDWTDADGDGAWDDGEGERWMLSRADDPTTTDVDETGWYEFDDLPADTYIVREIVPAGHVQTAPIEPHYHYHRVDLLAGAVADGRDFGNRATPGCIDGLKGLDADDSGTFDPGEPGQGGVIVYLDINHNGKKDPGEPYTVTASDGSFQFTGVAPGVYDLREEVPEGFEQIAPAGGAAVPVTVTAGETTGGVLLVNVDRRGWIWGLKWLDLDGDGERDDDEPGLPGVRIYVDRDNNGRWRSNEPSAITLEDDPATPDVDESGMWTIPDIPAGTYTIREVSPDGLQTSFPAGGAGHIVTVLPEEGSGPWLFGNAPILPFICGWKFYDLDRDGERDRNRVRGERPLLVFVVDLSDSTRNTFDGTAPGDVNGDGQADTVLDGELAGVIAANQELIDQGLDATTEVAVVVFGEEGYQIDMDPVAPGLQLTARPSADADGNGIPDVEQALRSLDRDDYGAALRTDYAAALTTAEYTIQLVNPPAGSANVLFVSDGEPNNPTNYDDDVARLQAMGVNLSAFGAGDSATMYTLRVIDPDAVIFTNPGELVAAMDIRGSASPDGSSAWAGSSDGLWLERGLAGIVVYLDQNDNGALDWTDLDADGAWDDGEGERWTLSQYDDPATDDLDETGYYCFDDLVPGVYIVREILPDGWLASDLPLKLRDAFLCSYLSFTRALAEEVDGGSIFNYGAEPGADRFGVAETAYSFDGTDFMMLAPEDLPAGSEARTLSVWVRSANGVIDRHAEHIVNWGRPLVNQSFGFGLFAENKWAAYGYGSDMVSGVDAGTDWHNLMLSFNGSRAWFYVDGQLVASGTRAWDTPETPLILGTRQNLGPEFFFDGDIDDIRIYSRAFAPEEMTELYEWERTHAILDDAWVVRVDYGESIGDLDFGDYRPEAAATAEHVFANASAMDGWDPAANTADDAAIFPGKAALHPGEVSSPANCTGSSRGITGVMIDVEGLVGVPTAADFEFRTGAGGDPAGWEVAAEPLEISTRFCASGLADRVTMTWTPHAVENTWLQVTVRATETTGLDEPHVFYFANLAGDIDGDGYVGARDYMGMKWASGGASDGVGGPDLDGDGEIGREDFMVLAGRFGQSLEPFEAPLPIPAPAAIPSAETAPDAVFAAAALAEAAVPALWVATSPQPALAAEPSPTSAAVRLAVVPVPPSAAPAPRLDMPSTEMRVSPQDPAESCVPSPAATPGEPTFDILDALRAIKLDPASLLPIPW